MARPPLATAPGIDELGAVADPIERAAAISQLAQVHGTLSPALAAARRAAILAARAAGHRVHVIATRTGLSHGRVSQLSNRPSPEESS